MSDTPSNPPEAPATVPATATAPARRWRKGAWAAAWLLALGALLLSVLALPFTAAGSRWLLGAVPGLQVDGAQGALAGNFQARQLRYALSGSQVLVIAELRWQGWHAALGERVLTLDRLSARRVALQGTPAPSTAPLVLPSQLQLPLALRLEHVEIGEIALPALGDQPLRALQARLRLGGTGGHELDLQQLRWDHFDASGQARLQAGAPLGLAATLALRPTPAAQGATTDQQALPPDSQLTLSAQGPLARLQLLADLKAAGQNLHAQAELRLDEALPLRQLDATLQSLDLSALASGLPQTALSGQVHARLNPAADPKAPATLGLQALLDNSRPGRLDEQRLPVRHLELQAHSHADHPERGELQQLLLQLGDERTSAGTLQGQGDWQLGPITGQRLQLQLRLDQLQPARLSAQAPALRLSGPLQLAYTRAPGQTTAAAVLPAGAVLTLQGELTGQTTAPSTGLAAAAPVRVRLQARLDDQHIDLQELQASAGPARLQAKLLLRHEARTPASAASSTWAALGQAQLARFDPALWWPASGRSGPSNLDAGLTLDLRLPEAALSAPSAWDALAQLQGLLQLQLLPSQLAGVPVHGELQLRRQGSDSTVLGSAKLMAADTQLDGQAQFNAHGGRHQLQLKLASANIDRLKPWLQLLGPTLSPSGDLRGDVDLQVQGSSWTSHGSLDSQQLRLDRHTAAAAGQPASSAILASGSALQARWSLGSDAQAPLELDLRLQQARWGSTQLQAVQFQGKGSTAHHQLQLNADMRQGDTSSPLRALVQLDGGLQTSASTQAWQGQVQQLQLTESTPAPGQNAGQGPSPATTAPRWNLQLSPAPLSLVHQNADGRSQLDLNLGATTLSLADARLRIDELHWQSLGSSANGVAPQPSLRLRAKLEPMALAPLLARWEPDFGWAGDLLIGGSVDVDASADHVRASAALQRDSGDLRILDTQSGRPAQILGISELRLALDARDGRWRFSQQLAGRNLGSLQGEQTAQTLSSAWAPSATTPVQGQLTVQIAQLGNWGRWLPAGWRLSGQLAGQARVTGQLGGPEFSGELTGQQIAVRNLLEGVDWNDARLKLVLRGDNARLEQFSVRGGAGRLEAQGDLRLGAEPSAKLDISADHFAALQRVDRRVVASGQAQLQIDRNSTRLTGRIVADEGLIDFSQGGAPSLADDVDVQRQTSPGRQDATGSDPERPRRTLALDLRADLGKQFRLRGRGLTTRLAGELHITSPNNKLAVQGDIRAEDGTYSAYAQKLRIERGLISFTGVPDNPRLNILAIRPDLEDQIVGVAVTGTAQNPRIRLYSDPELTDTEKLSWLILGRGPDGLGRTDLALLQRAAFALLTGESDSPSLVERIGLDQLSVRQSDSDTKETVVSLGKQLSRRWYVGYERSLNAEAGTWQLIYRLAKRYTLRAQSGTDSALDIIWTWKWGTDQPAKP
jgi:translocation and assembly module TamB